MSGPSTEPAGLPALAMGMVVACVGMMVATNRKFGHQTFHNSKAVVGDRTASGRGSDGSTSRSNDNSNNSRRAFEGLSDSGVLETAASFLSPAELVGIATVSTDFCRASASSFLWRCHYERAFGASRPHLLGRWHRAEHGGHVKQFLHQEKPEEQDRGSRSRLHHKLSEGDADERVCRCSRAGSRRQHRWRLSEGVGNGDRHASPASHFRRSCPDSTCHNYSWREAFFRSHRAKPRDLLRQLSTSFIPASTSTAAQHPPPHRPPTPRPCVIVLHERVHDLTEFLPSHPGGSLILQEHAFTDATPAFER